MAKKKPLKPIEDMTPEPVDPAEALRDPTEADLKDIEPLMKKDPLVGNDPVEDEPPVVNPFPVNQDPTHFNPVINPGVVIAAEPEDPDDVIRRD